VEGDSGDEAWHWKSHTAEKGSRNFLRQRYSVDHITPSKHILARWQELC